ncbi:hypothetical protein [Mycolicibacterium elephantis]|nr:hypothetical protein [Mycolicibacterium elephantis]
MTIWALPLVWHWVVLGPTSVHRGAASAAGAVTAKAMAVLA